MNELSTSPPRTCEQHLNVARDSMDMALEHLTGASGCCSGLASLLLLDMIRETSTMAARIRRIIQEASGDALARVGRQTQDHESRRLNQYSGGPGGKGGASPDEQLNTGMLINLPKGAGG